MEQTTITTYGPLALRIRELSQRYPGATANRIGRALLHVAIQTYDPEHLTRVLAALTARDEPSLDWVGADTAADEEDGNSVPPTEKP